MNVSCVHSIKKAYLEGVREKRKADSDEEETSSLPVKKRGRPFIARRKP